MRFALASIVIGILSACSTVQPGQVYLQVDVCTGSEESRYKVVRGGRVWGGPCTEYHAIPVREQREVWSQVPEEGEAGDQSVSFAGVDGQKVNVDISVGYQVAPTDEEIIRMVQKFGPDLATTIDGRVRDSTRNALQMCAATQKLTVQDIYGAGKEGLFACVEKSVQDEYNRHGLQITRLTLNSEVRLPQQVAEKMEQAQAATQDADKARREVEKTEAEGQKAVASAKAEAEALLTKARAEAEANEIITKSLTPGVLEMRRLEIQLKQAERWDGKLPQTVLGTEGGLIIDLSSQSK